MNKKLLFTLDNTALKTVVFLKASNKGIFKITKTLSRRIEENKRYFIFLSEWVEVSNQFLFKIYLSIIR